VAVHLCTLYYDSSIPPTKFSAYRGNVFCHGGVTSKLICCPCKEGVFGKGDAVYRYRNPQDGHPRRGEGRVASNKVGVASPGTGRLNGRRCLLGGTHV
jgi:hypothetical protein